MIEKIARSKFLRTRRTQACTVAFEVARRVSHSLVGHIRFFALWQIHARNRVVADNIPFFRFVGLLNQTKTPQGRYLLKQWLLRPSLSMTTIRERHQTVECFVRTENQPTVNQLAESLSHIKNVPKVLQAMSRKATINDWQSILEVCMRSFLENSLSFDTLISIVPNAGIIHFIFLVCLLLCENLQRLARNLCWGLTNHPRGICSSFRRKWSFCA